MLTRRQLHEKALLALGASVVASKAWSLNNKPSPVSKAPAVAPKSNINPNFKLQISAGRDYLEISPPIPTDVPAGKIELLEFFWYNCPHCYHLDDKLSQWVKTLPSNVIFRRVPVRFRENFKPQQQLYYTLEVMGLVEQMHAKIFTAIHVNKEKLNDPDAIFSWVAKQGVDINKFKSTFVSFSVDGKANRAAKLQDAYTLDGVPALTIAGKYVCNATMAGSVDRLLLIASELIARQSQSR